MERIHEIKHKVVKHKFLGDCAEKLRLIKIAGF